MTNSGFSGDGDEDELAKLREIAESARRLAHDANTPLGVIRQAAHVLTAAVEELEVDAAGQELLDDIREACELINRNVVRADSLLTQFRADAEAPPDRRCIDVLELLEEMRRSQTLGRRDGLTVRISCALDSEERRWTGDVEALWRVLTNLISNAERYAYPSGDGGLLELELTRDGPEHLLLTVRDFGAGIPEEHLPVVFAPGFTTGEASGGTGRGLAIVDELVNDVLGGRVAVRSRCEEGTTIEVRLPVAT